MTTAQYQSLLPASPGRRPMRPWIVIGAAVLIIFGASFHWHFSPATPTVKLPPLSHNDDSHYQQCRHVGGPDHQSKYLGGSPGYEVFENVWMRGQDFYIFTRDPKHLPPTDHIVSPRMAVIVEAEAPDAVRPDYCFDGTTVFFNEGAGEGWNGLGGFYGFFVENVLGAYAALSNAIPTTKIVVDNAVIPWDAGWRGESKSNGALATALWGKNVVEPDQFKRMQGGADDAWVFFERIVMVDRWAAHRHSKEVTTWNKMAAGVFSVSHYAHFWDAARARVHEYFDVPKPVRFALGGRKHHIVYLDRQDTKRHLSLRQHQALLHTMRELARKKGAAFTHLVLTDLSVEEQIQAVSTATIMVSVHGRAMTNMLWMPPKSSVIELFPLDTFMREYELPASVLGFHYTAIRNRDILKQEDWEADPGVKNIHKAHDGTAVTIHMPLLVDTVRSALDRPL